MNRRLRGALAGLVGGVVGGVVLATPAAAHVTVNPAEATQGGYARLAFRVPTESDTLSTVKLEVQLPSDHPITSVRTAPVPGWTVDVQRRTLEKPIESHGGQITEAVSVITWTAAAEAAIRPGQFQEFPVSLGPLPEVDVLVFKALQTYSDNSVVRWIDEPAADGVAPERPAPTLKLAAKGAAADAHGAATGATAAGGPGGRAESAPDGAAGAALGLGAAGLVAGLGGLALGAVAVTRTRGRRT